MDLIFMLTKNDRTIDDCLEVVEYVAGLEIRNLGFKDIGPKRAVLEKLNQRIQESGAQSYMELVSTDPSECIESARFAAKIGVNHLLGGVNPKDIVSTIQGSRLAYYPFPGIPRGHPTRLEGSLEQIVADCLQFDRLGCQGVDLLAYRCETIDPLMLVQAVRSVTTRRMVVAGSIDSPQRVRALRALGVDAFTLGSAAFNGSFSPRKGMLSAQLQDILSAARGEVREE